MIKRMLLVFVSSIALLDGALRVLAQEKASLRDERQDRHSVSYEAEEELPKDKTGERRRDYSGVGRGSLANLGGVSASGFTRTGVRKRTPATRSFEPPGVP